MTVLNLADQISFTTKDGSTIRSILDCTNAPVKNQSLAEASVPAGGSTQRHYHRLSEEFYFILEGKPGSVSSAAARRRTATKTRISSDRPACHAARA